MAKETSSRPIEQQKQDQPASTPPAKPGEVPAKPTTQAKSPLPAVDYPVVVCPFCTSKNTMRLPERPPEAVKGNWWKRWCRMCDRTFKAEQ